MDTEPLYCAEQIKVPEGLPELLRLFSKEVIRAQPPPEKLYEWAAQYFTEKAAAQAAESGAEGQ